jgi:RNA recognition motif-containing protein
MNNRLYVENLSPAITDGVLRELFSKTGPVVDVTLLLDPGTGRSNGRAYVTMATPELAAAALALHSHSLDGRNIAVTQARPVVERPAGMIGQGFDHYQGHPGHPAHDQKSGGRRPKGGGGGQNRGKKRRFAPSR